MTIAYLALGSNLGDRKSQFQFALAELEKRGVRIVARSKDLPLRPALKAVAMANFSTPPLRVETER